MRAIRWFLTACAAVVLQARPAAAGDALDRVLALAGTGRAALEQGGRRSRAPGGFGRPLAIVGELAESPLRAGYRAGLLAGALADYARSPWHSTLIAAELVDAEVARGGAVDDRATREALLGSADPLAEGLRAMVAGLAGEGGWEPPGLPEDSAMPRALRLEIARVLVAIGQAERFRRRAFARLPPGMDRAQLLGRFIEGRRDSFDEPDLRTLIPAVEREALMAGMQELVAAVQALRDFLVAEPRLPALDWQLETPLGQILVDTRGASSTRTLPAPLLLVDLGGDDSYRFEPDRAAGPISVLLEVGGNDSYLADGIAAAPSAAVLGYGIQWDSGGDDRYQGAYLDQAAALLGAALLVDEDGSDAYSADGYAQGFAVGGVAVLLDFAGADRYRALTHAQASAGPEGAAALVDLGGDDDYLLAGTPVVAPSSQLPDRNASIGQGMGQGWRHDRDDGRSLDGGLGILVDAAGNDHYRAEVFAQGAGYWGGAGLLVDGGGDDVYQAAWYAQGAAAHRGVGVLVDRGAGSDRYQASHSTAMAAAHDESLAVLIDEGGDDRYALGTLGLGAVHDDGVALFADFGGADRYRTDDTECRAFGAAIMERWGGSSEDATGLGLFLDLGGRDDYPAGCARTGDDRGWAWPRAHPALALPSEAGAGLDTEAPPPLLTGARTPRLPDPWSAANAVAAARAAWRTDPRYLRAPSLRDPAP